MAALAVVALLRPGYHQKCPLVWQPLRDIALNQHERWGQIQVEMLRWWVSSGYDFSDCINDDRLSTWQPVVACMLTATLAGKRCG